MQHYACVYDFKIHIENECKKVNAMEEKVLVFKEILQIY